MNKHNIEFLLTFIEEDIKRSKKFIKEEHRYSLQNFYEGKINAYELVRDLIISLNEKK